MKTARGREDIDEAMLDFGMPMGPLRLIDEVGVDIAADVAATLAAKFSDRLRVPPGSGQNDFRRLAGPKERARLLYLYGKGKAKPNPRLVSLRHSDDSRRADRAELQKRLALLMVNEAARCVEEQISPDRRRRFCDGHGHGFAPFRGGPLRYADAFGLSRVVDELERLSVTRGRISRRCDLLETTGRRRKTLL